MNNIRTFSVASALTLIVVSHSWSQNPEPKTPQLTNREVLAKTIDYCLIGGSSPDKNVLKIGRARTSKGWEPYIESQTKLGRDSGARGLWLHNPWGHDGEWPMRWDQRMLLLERIEQETDPETIAKLKRVEETFLPAMQRYLRGEWSGGQKPHLWVYLGTALHNPSMEELEHHPLEYKRRWQQSVLPVVALSKQFPGQVSLGMDRTFDTPEDHPHFAGAVELAELGIEIVSEPRPVRKHPHWHRFGFVNLMREGGWDRTDPLRFPDANRLGKAPDSLIQGNMYGLIGGNYPDDLLNLQACRNVIERGWTPVMYLGKLDLAKLFAEDAQQARAASK